jgi:purine-binding chemotaxis protein CheW
MGGLFLIASISGSAIAIDSARVESVVRIGEIQRVPNCSPLVAGLFALRSRVLTVIDSQFLITGVSQQFDADSIAIVVSVAGHSYALLVDSVADAVNLDDVKYLENVSVDAAWRKIASGVMLHKTQMLMVVEIDNLIAEREELVA